MSNPTPIDDGGPAFPTTPVSHGYDPGTNGLGTGCGPGMTLRDWFAGQSMAGMLANPEGSGKLHELAQSAYLCADAMIKARNTQP